MNEIHLSRSPGPVTNTALAPWCPSFEELAETLGKPTIGSKDGTYFVRGPINGTAIRADEHIPEANVVVIDGDSRMDPENGTIESGAPHPLLVHEALVDADVTHVIYTSHSHGGDKGNRWRAVIPAAIGQNHEALLATVDHLIGVLHRAAVFVAPARENYAWAQAWYYPRVRDAGAEFLTFAHDGGEVLDVAGIVAQWQERQPRQPDVAPDAKRPKGADTLIGKYVAEHGDPAKMAGLLEAKGYILKSAHHLNGAPCYRYLHPRSQTRQPGVLLYRARNGIWRVCSHHGDYDPLAVLDPQSGKVLAHDAFDLFRLFEHGGDLAKALKAIDPRPVIRVYGGSLRPNTEQSIRALAKQEPPAVYQRGSLLTRIAHLPETTELLGMTIPHGTATLIQLSQTDMRLRLADAAIFQRAAQRDGVTVWNDTDPPPNLAQAVLTATGEWGNIPVLISVAEAPLIRPDGTLFDRRGYDHASRLYYEGGAPALKVAASPGHGDAVRAARYLLRPFAEFPFADQQLDESVVLALLLTLALRPTLDLAPLVGVSATSPGTGKGLLVEICNLIIRGRDAAIMPPPGGVDGDAETRKRITALLLQGLSSVLLDNWTTAIGGDAMNTLFTAAQWSDRLLGTNQSVTLPGRVTWTATGNNLTVRGDMVRRTLLAVLDAKTERPELRKFKERDLVSTVRRMRGDLLSALFTILRAYRLAREPEKNGPVLGRFEPWSRAVSAPIRWLGWPDPVKSQDRLRAVDPETIKLGTLLESWYHELGSRTVTVSELIDAAVGDGHSCGAPSGTRAALRDALEDVAGDRPGLINRRRLGWFLRHFNGRVCNGFSFFVDNTRQDVLRYRVGLAECVPK